MAISDNKHDPSIDYIKGIALILMVVGHSGFPFSNWIYLFHMAAFFIASGYCWNDSHSNSIEDIRLYIMKKLKTLYVPYVVVSGLCVVFNNFFVRCGIYSDTLGGVQVTSTISIYEIVKELLQIFLFLGSKHTQLAGAFWFLRCLFIVNVLYCFVDYVDKKINGLGKLKALSVVVCSVFAEFVSRGYFSFLHGFRTVFCAYVIYVFGIGLKKYEHNVERFYNLWGATVAFIGLCFMTRYGTISISAGIITNTLFFLISSFMGWVMLYAVSQHLGRMKNLIQLVNKSSIWVMALHFLSFKIVTLTYIKYNNLPEMLLASFPVLDTDSKWLWIAYSTVGVIMPVLCYLCWERIRRKRVRKQRVDIK